MNMVDFFASVEATLLANFNESGVVTNPTDKGDNREEFLRCFLADHLPKRYGVAKGQIVTKDGALSHSADVIVYDRINCPVLFSGNTLILPVEGVYGIVEVKSHLSKQELVDAMTKIESFKRLAPRDLSLVETREYITLHRPSRPFGAVFSYSLAGNSLESLAANFLECHARIHDVNYFTNLACVLGTGLVHYEKADLGTGQKSLLLSTDEFVDIVLLAEKRQRTGEPPPEVHVRVIADAAADKSFGRFFVYLLILLSRMKVGVPDLGRYLDSDLPQQIVRES